MADDAAKRAWLLKVLGIDLAAREDEGTEAEWTEEAEDTDAPPADPLAIWTEAKEQVDAGLNALIRVMQAEESPTLQRIAGFGLFGLTQGQTVALNKALREYQASAGPARAAAAKQVQAAAQSYRALLTGRPVFAKLDDNPFGIEVGLVDRLGGALARIESAVS